jgi:hypothetical protein
VFVDGLMEKLGGDQYRAQITHTHIACVYVGSKIYSGLKAVRGNGLSLQLLGVIWGKVSNGSRE